MLYLHNNRVTDSVPLLGDRGGSQAGGRTVLTEGEKNNSTIVSKHPRQAVMQGGIHVASPRSSKLSRYHRYPRKARVQAVSSMPALPGRVNGAVVSAQRLIVSGSLSTNARAARACPGRDGMSGPIPAGGICVTERSLVRLCPVFMFSSGCSGLKSDGFGAPAAWFVRQFVIFLVTLPKDLTYLLHTLVTSMRFE